MNLYNQIINIGPVLFIFMELLEPLLQDFVMMDKMFDKARMFVEPKVTTFDFIIGMSQLFP
jgi:hypothetical protein